MTTDTAVRVTRIVVEQKSQSFLLSHPESVLTARLVPLAEISYLDYPELKWNEHESTEMPFRYVKGEDDKPIMPKVSWLGFTRFARDRKH